MHQYKVNCLYIVLDLQLRDFNEFFSEVNTELLIYVAFLFSIGLFSEFNHSKLMKLATFYPYNYWDF